MKYGVYTVVNDRMANQLIAFLNSFKRNWPDHPLICIIPYDSHCEKVSKIIQDYRNVVMFDDQKALEQLDIYLGNLWMSLESAVRAWKSKGKHCPFRIEMSRRFIGLTKYGLFDQFIYLDTDIYVMKSLDVLFEELQSFDVVAHDFQGFDPSHVFNLKSTKLSSILNGEIKKQIQCGGLITTKRDLFTEEEWLQIPRLVKEDEEVIYPWAPDQSFWNYVINKFRKKFVNLVQHWPKEKVTHDAQTYTKFVFENGKLYEDGKEVLYFHHIGVPADEFNRICDGKEPSHPFRYQDVFKYYRFMKQS